jgi:hypothetical protein
VNSLKNPLGLVSIALLLPALFLGATGILQFGFGVEAAKHLPDVLMGQTVFKWLLSPVVVLGGPLVVFALNAWQVFHLSADNVNEEFVIALSVKRAFGRLFCLALAGGLVLLLGAYAFVENFQVVSR